MNIIGYFRDYLLVSDEDQFLVVKRSTRKILFVGSEEHATKLFIMLASDFIKDLEKRLA